MMRGRKGQRDTKPTPLHSMNDIPRDGYTGFPRAWPMSQEKRRWLPPGHGRCLKRSAAGWIPCRGLHYGKHISLRPMVPHCRSGYKGGMFRDKTLPYRHRRTALLSWKIHEYRNLKQITDGATDIAPNKTRPWRQGDYQSAVPVAGHGHINLSR